MTINKVGVLKLVVFTLVTTGMVKTDKQLLAETPAKGVELSIQVPESISAKWAIPVRAKLVNKSNKKGIGVWPQGLHWMDLLDMARATLSLGRIETGEDGASRSVPVRFKPLPGGNRDSAITLYLLPGKSIAYDFDLRQIFAFPENDIGDYRLTFSMAGHKVIKAFRVTSSPKDVVRLAHFKARLENGDDTDRELSIDIDLVKDGTTRKITGRSTWMYTRGTALLATGGTQLDQAQAAHAFRLKHVEVEEKELDVSKPPEIFSYEYVGVAWVRKEKIFYTTYGIANYEDYEYEGDVPKGLRVVPDFRQLRKASALEIAGDVAELVKMEAATDGYITIDYKLRGGSQKSLRVGENGIVPLSSEKKVSSQVDAPPEGQRALRTWTDNTGKNTVEARLVELKQSKVHLKKTDGDTISLPLNKLSKAD